jgi:hypothetical protein
MDKEMIERLKTTCTAFGGLSAKEQAFLKRHSGHVGILGDDGKLGSLGGWCFNSPYRIYRLSPDYEEPKTGRWFFHIPTLTVHEVVPFVYKAYLEDSQLHDSWLEVQEGDMPYLQKPEGDWEFRIPMIGDTFIGIDGNIFVSKMDHDDKAMYGGRRWCKPRKTGRWVEYPIVPSHDNKLHLEVHGINEFGTVDRLCRCPIYMLPSIVGFGGVQFKEQKNDEWSFELNCGLTKGGETSMYSPEIVRPATPIKARFWVKN